LPFFISAGSGIQREVRARVAEHQPGHRFGDDAPADFAQLARVDRLVALRRGDRHRRLDRLGKDVRPERAVAGEDRAEVGDRPDDVGGVAAELADQNFAVLERDDTHRLGDRLTARQPHPPAALEVAEREDLRAAADILRQVAERVHQRRIDLVRKLDPVPVPRIGQIGRIAEVDDVEIDEEPPVDRPLRRKFVEAAQVRLVGVSGEDRMRLRQRLVELILGPDHRVAEAVRRRREFERHERLVLGVVEFELRRVGDDIGPSGKMRQHLGQHRGRDDRWQIVVEHDPLIVPADRRLRGGEIAELGGEAVVKAQEQPLELRDDDVLVVARVADDRALVGVRDRRGRGKIAPRQVLRPRIVRRAGQRTSEVEVEALRIEVRLIVGTAAIDVVEIEPRRPVIDQRAEIVLFLQAARRVEGQVVIDELAEVGISRGDAALLRVGAVERRLVLGQHARRKRRQRVDSGRLVLAEPGGRVRAEHPSERPAEQQRTARQVRTTNPAVRTDDRWTGHRVLPPKNRPVAGPAELRAAWQENDKPRRHCTVSRSRNPRPAKTLQLLQKFVLQKIRHR
jgi:hypothetical protein